MSESPGRILVVDDEANMRRTLAKILARKGFEVETAEDGVDALAKLDADAYHIIVTDLAMPRMDGLELLGKLRERRDDVSVIVVTGQGSIQSAVEAMRQGAQDYLLKPYDPETIIQTLTRTLEIRLLKQELERARLTLIQSEKMAALGSLVAGVAHEINTPMGAIHSNNDLFGRILKKVRAALEEGAEREKLADLLDRADNLVRVSDEASSRVIQIIRSLKNFVRLDEAECKEADLHEGLESTLTLVRHEFKNRIRVVKEYGEIGLVECRPNEINQVFMNLLINAAQAIKGTGTVTLRTAPLGEDAVTVEIADDGPGVKAEDANRIFESGYTTKGEGLGTGLGLSICRQIVEKHGGRIELRNAPGKGAAFSITLPRKRTPRGD